MFARFIFLVLPLSLFSQRVQKADTIFCDCEKARTVLLKGNTKVGPTIAPAGGGEKNEINSHLQRSKFAFDKEHNSAWYKLVISSQGFLVFEITPAKPEDDYDFILFKGQTSGFCDSMTKFHLKPLRACISRGRKELNGLTGLGSKGKKELIKQGIGDAFAKPITVKPGEVYYLVLDNVYNDGGGHTIDFYFEEIVAVKGITRNEYESVSSEITITAPNGDTIKKLNSDKNGAFDFEAQLKQNLKYSLNFYNDSGFFATKEISTHTNKDTLKNIVTILPTLKKGNKYIIQNINFQPGLTSILPTALPSVKNLARLMRKNPGLKILIIGHMNGCDRSEKSDVAFTNNRALTVKKYLTDHLISSERISTDGKGCKEMLYPLTNKTPEWQQVLNRRVEIFITDK